MRLEEFLEQETELVRFAPGDTLIREGAQADAAYYIAEGAALVYRATQEGKEKKPESGDAVIARLKEGDIIGEMAILRFDSYTLSVRAEDEVKAYKITPDILHAQVRDTPPLVREILNLLVDRIFDVNETLIAIDRAEKP